MSLPLKTLTGSIFFFNTLTKLRSYGFPDLGLGLLAKHVVNLAAGAKSMNRGTFELYSISLYLVSLPVVFFAL